MSEKSIDENNERLLIRGITDEVLEAAGCTDSEMAVHYTLFFAPLLLIAPVRRHKGA